MTILAELLNDCPALAGCKADIYKAYSLLRDTLAGGGRVYVCGNGGSAADCQHIVGEMMKGFHKKRPVALPAGIKEKLTPQTAELLSNKLQGALPCHSLTAETALITALCNDVSADIVFAQQVYGYGKPGDCLVAISTSGEAVNVCLAVELAAAMGMHTVAMTGRRGGKLAEICDAAIRVPADSTPKVQEYHLPVYHALCAELEDAFFPEKRILLASPRGFCKGVERGVKMLEDAIRQEEGTVYARKEIVHNTLLVDRFKSLGVVFADELDEIPDGSAVVFSAHGVAPSVREMAAEKKLKVIDATCPLVAKVHEEAIMFKNQGYTIVLIGIPDHPEVIGITAEAPDNIRLVRDERDFDNLTGIDGSRIAWLSQTTLNADETQKTVGRLREKFPLLQDPPQSGICYATKERQSAVRKIANNCDLFIAVGSEKSSNTQRLAEVALESGAKRAFRVDKPEELKNADFSSVDIIGISSGNSVAEEQLTGVIAYLGEIGYNNVEEAAAAL